MDKFFAVPVGGGLVEIHRIIQSEHLFDVPEKDAGRALEILGATPTPARVKRGPSSQKEPAKNGRRKKRADAGVARGPRKKATNGRKKGGRKKGSGQAGRHKKSAPTCP